ncbi:MAG TPA: HAD family hydrolase [Gemmatimonadales bacterium]|jgi:FMN phosphatase YigB (HAD superfamily)|nr:HAD family hydrolase [Gemmatimonadales bacterium]
MNGPADLVIFFDCDNTLLDNDGFQHDLRARLERDFGAARAAGYWTAYEDLRRELGYADYLGALERFRDRNVSDDRILELAAFLLDYPFADRLYPHALDVIAKAGRIGTTVMLSDGDAVFQPWKLRRSGLWDAVDGRVLLYVHKDRQLAEVARRYPARHYVMVDDKLRILAAMKAEWGLRLTTVFPRQGHYATDPRQVDGVSAADVAVEHIADLLNFDFAAAAND